MANGSDFSGGQLARADAQRALRSFVPSFSTFLCVMFNNGLHIGGVLGVCLGRENKTGEVQQADLADLKIVGILSQRKK